MTIEATKSHLTFVPEPTDVTGLVDQISAAIVNVDQDLGNRPRTLSLRERQVLGFVVDELLNTQVAYRLASARSQ
jgi:FixJ family two-component response regulator